MPRKSAASRRPPLIALDGPSALQWYRGRDARIASREFGTDEYEYDYEDESLEDLFHLSDEDIAASLASTVTLAGMRPWAQASFGGSSDAAMAARAVRSEPNRADILDDARVVELCRTRIRSLQRCASQAREIKLIPFDELGLTKPCEDSPLHILVPGKEAIRRVKNVRQRSCGGPVPPNSLRKLGESVLVPTPEFTFLLLAQHLELVELVMVGMELCGHYRLADASSSRPLEAGGTLYDRPALTTPQKLLAFLGQADGFRGVLRATRACKLITAHSSSPMETVVYLLLCLPRRLGGYGLERPVLNAKRAVNSYAEAFTLARTLIPDLYWPAAHLDLEYDSNQFHASAQSLVAGARRTLALRAMHVEVISATYDIVCDEVAFAALVRHIALRLGKRLVPEDRKFELRRYALRRLLLRQGS